MSGILFFFFKQKTAYEMRISDWSSDVCSSDLGRRSASDRDVTVGLDRVGIGNRAVRHFDGRMHRRVREGSRGAVRYLSLEGESRPIGRASCRERVCPYVYISVVAVSLKKTKITEKRSYSIDTQL